MKINLGLSTMMYHHEPIAKLFPFLIDWKMRTIEIRPHTGHLELRDSDSIDQLKKRIDHDHIVVSAIHMPMNGVDISHTEEYDRVRSIREVQKSVIVAHRFGAGLVVVHPGGKCSTISERESRFTQCIKSLTEILDFCCQWDVKLAVENTIPGRLGDRWEEIQQIIEVLSSENVGICLDTGHYLLNQRKAGHEEFNFDIKFINWQKKLFHIHIHDNDGEKDLHLLPGEGDFPWSLFISFLQEIHYHHMLILELKDQNQLTYYDEKIRRIYAMLKTLAE